MPLPMKNKGETKKDFMSRCMGNQTMNKEFPDKGQRFKVCEAQANKSRTNSMVILSAETGTIRSEKFNGRDHTVVPIIGLVEGVIHASNSPVPELAPANEIEKSVPGFNGRPIILDHPEKNGIKVSANSPDIIETQVFGTLFNSHFEDKKLKFEAFIDTEKANEIGGEVADTVKALENGDVLEVSTGMFVDIRDAFGIFDGKEFFGVWENFVPDHLAIMSKGKKGACSVEDGCGTNRLNAAGDPCEDGKCDPDSSRFTSMVERIRSFLGLGESMKSKLRGIQALLDSEGNWDFAIDISDNEVIIDTRDGLVRRPFSISDDGKVTLSGDSVQVRARTEFIDLKTASATERKAEMDKEKRVKALIENPQTRFAEDHKEFLMGLEDKQLELLEPVKEEKSAEVKAAEAKAAEAAEKKAADEAAEKKAAELKAAEEKKVESKPQSAEDYIASAPVEVRAVLQSGMRSLQARKDELISVIKANGRNKFSDQQLADMDDGMLENLANLASEDDYSGRGGPRALSDGKGEEDSIYAPEPPDCFAKAS